MVALLSDDGSEYVTRHETKTSTPIIVRKVGELERQPLTEFMDPAKSLREVQKKLITYERADGVMLNCMLHLPPGYDLENPLPLPTILWAYPRAYTRTNGRAGFNSPHRFSPLRELPPVSAPAGYAVLDQVAMPIVGDPEMANDTFTEQIVANAEAAIDAVVKMGFATSNAWVWAGTVTGRLWR